MVDNLYDSSDQLLDDSDDHLPTSPFIIDDYPSSLPLSPSIPIQSPLNINKNNKNNKSNKDDKKNNEKEMKGGMEGGWGIERMSGSSSGYSSYSSSPLFSPVLHSPLVINQLQSSSLNQSLNQPNDFS